MTGTYRWTPVPLLLAFLLAVPPAWAQESARFLVVPQQADETVAEALEVCRGSLISQLESSGVLMQQDAPEAAQAASECVGDRVLPGYPLACDSAVFGEGVDLAVLLSLRQTDRGVRYSVEVFHLASALTVWVDGLNIEPPAHGLSVASESCAALGRQFTEHHALHSGEPPDPTRHFVSDPDRLFDRVRRELHRHMRPPDTLTLAQLEGLRGAVIIYFTSEGRVREYRWHTRTGSADYESAVELSLDYYISTGQPVRALPRDGEALSQVVEHGFFFHVGGER